MTPFISFIVPVRDDARHLRLCLASIAAAANHPEGTLVEIVVADNGSVDGSDRAARETGARVAGLPGLGLGALRNAAARETTGRILAFVDSDHEISRDWIAAAMATLQLPNVAATGALCHAPDSGSWVQRRYATLRRVPPGIHDVEWLGGGNLAVWRSAFDRIGGFDPTLDTSEDVDFCRRLRLSAMRIVSNSQLKSVHHGDPSTLYAMFLGELWRGRDVLRVNLRRPWSWSALPGAAIPLVNLAAMGVAVAGLATLSRAGMAWSLSGLGVLVTLTAIRALRMLRHRADRGTRASAEALAIAGVFHVARALAVVVRLDHRHRQR
jgi:glycosyltransferase involved in cell wall biosynthesis